VAVGDVRFRQHIRKGGEVALLCYIDHPDGEVWLWSRVGTLNWDGQEWRGIGALGKVSGISKTTTLEVKQVVFELAGVPIDSMTDLLAGDVRNRSIKLWLAGIERHRVVGEPYLIIDDLMDFQTLSVSDDGTATLKITVNVGFWTIERAVNEAWTHESQIAEYPDDTGLSLLTTLANKQTNWRLRE
jgi:hypothetical protein